ncbi:ADP/ATP carrier protein [Balamuthia mandrillaris]
MATSFLVDMLLGGLSAGIAKLAAAPLENIKLLKQCQHYRSPLTDRIEPKYSEAYLGIPLLLELPRRTGSYQSLFGGTIVNLLRYFPTQALNFALKDYLRNLLPTVRRDRGFLLNFLSLLASGGAAGALSLAVVYPLDTLRTHMGLNAMLERPLYTGYWDCIKQLVSNNPLALYAGFQVSVLGIIFYRGFYFGLYDGLRPVRDQLDRFFPRNSLWQTSSRFVFAVAVSSAAGFITYPFDTIRRCQMLTGKSLIGATVAIVEEGGGCTALWTGAGENVLRTILSSLVLVGYDMAKSIVAPSKPKHT